MTAQNRAGKRRLEADADPSDSVPEADAAEQSARTAEEESDQWLENPAGRSLEQANEADVVEQLRELGADDEEEHR
ncbi:hypothetical protein KIK06_17290 [Nocardiopsis sp. EMB25]|uniref:hypothetical protein n=1 Tax=Nocardiopsis sp. EMB25 TaxID=2835867 RepID=UPI002284E11E|nr:hypothetical protein [Nocardiopsis sp. EMB25]MCY9785642.1 hypothetical protein [Nocardiopsis sp. EMB25]